MLVLVAVAVPMFAVVAEAVDVGVTADASVPAGAVDAFGQPQSKNAATIDSKGESVGLPPARRPSHRKEGFMRGSIVVAGA